MRKITGIIVVLFIVAALAVGCSSEEKISIENVVWRLETVLGSGGEALYVSEENHPYYPDAEVARCTLKAEDGRLELKDLNTQKIYTGEYSETTDGGARETIYEISLFADSEEYAVAAYTRYSDGSEEATLVISCPGENGYTIYFTGGEA